MRPAEHLPLVHGVLLSASRTAQVHAGAEAARREAVPRRQDPSLGVVWRRQTSLEEEEKRRRSSVSAPRRRRRPARPRLTVARTPRPAPRAPRLASSPPSPPLPPQRPRSPKSSSPTDAGRSHLDVLARSSADLRAGGPWQGSSRGSAHGREERGLSVLADTPGHLVAVARIASQRSDEGGSEEVRRLRSPSSTFRMSS